MALNETQTHEITVGDTLVPLAAALTRPDGTPINLTGLTTKFHMVNLQSGQTKVSETASNVVVTDATNGLVQYQFQAVDTDTTGLYAAWFIVIDGGGRRETVPCDGHTFLVQIEPAT